MSVVTYDENVGFERAGPAEIPFRIKFKAWWNGYDPIDLCPKLDPIAPPAAKEEAAPAAKPKPMALDESMTLLDLGCGLGGGARTIAKTFSTWVTGIEWWKELAVAGIERSMMAGMEKKAPVLFHGSDRLTLKPKSFNAIYSKEAMFTVPDKANLLEVMGHALRPGGQLCFTDYVLPGNGDPSPRVLEWQERELGGATPWSVEGYTMALQSIGLDLRIAEDMSEPHRQLIRAGWDQLQIANEGVVIGADTLPILIREAEIWARRMALLRKGDLKLYRFFAIKPA